MEEVKEREAKVTELEKQTAAGLAAFAPEVKLELDTAGAEAHKVEVEKQIEALKEEEAKLTGKDNKKARTEKAKQISALKADKKYIDATRVAKGSEPANGNFVLSKTGGEAPKPAAVEAPAAAAEAPKPDKAAAKPKKEKAGLTPDELAELETLKNDIIARKTQLKADGLSGGQQNKDEEIVKWVTRMNELKEKQDPGSTGKKEEPKKKGKGKLSAEDQAELDGLKGEIEAYKNKCLSEFGMTKKDIKVDPDMLDMEKRLADLEKRAK